MVETPINRIANMILVICSLDKPPKHKRKYGRIPQKQSEDQTHHVQDLSKIESILNDVLHILKHKQQGSSQGQVREKMRQMSKKTGILRVAIPNSYSFIQEDLDQFFGKYGKIEKIKIFKANQDQFQNTAFIFYNSYYSAILALRVLQSIPQTDVIVKGAVCIDQDLSQQIYVENGRLGLVDQRQFILFLESNTEKIQSCAQICTTFQHPIIAQEIQQWKYCCLMNIDIYDKKFNIKQRILGVRCANFLRVYYICQKACYSQDKAQHDFDLRLIINKKINTQNQVLILSNNIQKYKQAKASFQQLLAQIIEEYKNCMDKSFLVIKKEVHLRVAQKMNTEPQLKFLDK